MNKEIEDALHMLLHCSLKDTEYETQREQFKIVYNHIEELQQRIDKAIEYNKENKKFANEVENRYAEEICKNNLEILGDKDFK